MQRGRTATPKAKARRCWCSTPSDDTAARLYARLGWREAAGVIPRYALLPAGGECATTYFYRELSDVA